MTIDFAYATAITAYIVFAIALVFTDVLYLRVLLCVGFFLQMITAIFLHFDPMLIGNFILFIVGIYRIVQIIIIRSRIRLPKEAQKIYDALFKNILLPREFYNLYKKGNRVDFKDIPLVTEGEKLEYIYLLVKGKVAIYKNNALITTVKPYNFIGEMLYLTGEGATADAIAAGEVECLAWSHALLRKDKELESRFIKALNIVIMDKIKSQNATLSKASGN